MPTDSRAAGRCLLLFHLAVKCLLQSASFAALLQVFLWGKRDGVRSLILLLLVWVKNIM